MLVLKEKAEFCKAIIEQHYEKKGSLIAVIRSASQNHGSHQQDINVCEAMLWYKWSIWPTTDKKEGKMSSYFSLHVCTVISAQKQVWCSNQPLLSLVEGGGSNNSPELIISLVVFTFHMSSLVKECTLDIPYARSTKISIQCLHCQEIKNNMGTLRTSAQIFICGKVPSRSWHIQYTAVCFVNVC